MRRTIFAAAVPLTLLALAAPASAAGGKHAVVYKAELAPVAVAPEAGAARRGEDGVRGKALLVDGPRRDMARLHVRGLPAGEGYTWAVRQAASGGNACAGEAVAAFEYDAFDARRHGKGKARARSRDFASEEGAAYALVVTAADGTDVACGEFARRGRRHGEGGGRKGDDAGAKRGGDDAGGKRGGDDAGGDDAGGKRGGDDAGGDDAGGADEDSDSVEDEDSDSA